MKKLRCAIYTRKSSEEGLEQTFNSLDAQREACGAYILSQAGEGWTALKDIYDDGGFSGGSMERPALKRLMAEVEAKRIDVIVVYKVDRLTRSLADFARIVEILDRTGASFVSVTQAFNTTTSMGRLTLNVLLSFAQFEREVTGERIRDKVAASKAKGMWMGGYPPLGYDVRDRALHINDAEAETVRTIFTRYLSTANVFKLRDALSSDGVRSKSWTSRAGREHGGHCMSHGALLYILANPLYVGNVTHRGKAYPGQHQAIIDKDLFDAVQRKLAAGAPDLPGTTSTGRAAPLLGKIFDAQHRPMTSAHASKNGRRYFYYVSTPKTVIDSGFRTRVSAPNLEHQIQEAIAPLLASSWRPRDGAMPRIFAAVEKVVLGSKCIAISIAADAITSDSADRIEGLARDDDAWRLIMPNTLHQPASWRGVISSATAAAAPPRVDRALVRAIVQARRWTQMLASGEAATLNDLARGENLCPHYTGQLLPLAFLAPDLVADILDGRQPARLTLATLIARPLPHAFGEQRTRFAQFA
ncbi:MAG: recombinase family protein [Hyphomonadaceae bacterium]|nr:recombinase family protein [Hyphomonadaceae bacterium]